MSTTPLDKEILQEIVRVIRSEQKVPDMVEVQGKRYALTYLEDHYQRLTDALASRDANLLSILFGQLASKVKYQLVPSAHLPVKRGATRKKPQPKGKVPQKQTRGVVGRISTSRKSRQSAVTTAKTAATKSGGAQKLRGAKRKLRPKKSSS